MDELNAGSPGQTKENGKMTPKTKRGKKRSLLTDEQKEHLISMVSAQPHLWNTNLKNYHDEEMKSNTWNDLKLILLEITGLESIEIRWEWKQLRDSYFKTKRRQKTRSGQAAPSKQPTWKFFKMLQFLEQCDSEEQVFDAYIDDQGNVDSEIDLGDSATGSDVDDETASIVTVSTIKSGFIGSGPATANQTAPKTPTVPVLLADRPTTSKAVDPVTQTPKLARKRRYVKAAAKAEDELLKEMSSVANKLLEQNEEEAFGSYIATQLKKIPEKDKNKCMKAVADVLFGFLDD